MLIEGKCLNIQVLTNLYNQTNPINPGSDFSRQRLLRVTCIINSLFADCLRVIVSIIFFELAESITQEYNHFFKFDWRIGFPP